MVVSKSATQTYEQYSGDVEIMLVKKYNDLDSAMTYDGKYDTEVRRSTGTEKDAFRKPSKILWYWKYR